jgi:hypothetical protein
MCQLPQCDRNESVPCLYGIVFGALAGVHVESVNQLRNAVDAKSYGRLTHEG